MNYSKSRLIRICDSSRRKSFVKCCPSIVTVLQKGRLHFQKELTKVVLEIDGSMIVEDEVLEILSSEGCSFMLLGASEEWSPIERSTQQTQILQEPLEQQSEYKGVQLLNANYSTLSSIIQIEETNCDIVYAGESNLSVQEDPLTLPSTSRLTKRKPSLDNFKTPPHKHTALDFSTDDNSSTPSNTPSNVASNAQFEETNFVYASESNLSAQEPLAVPSTSGLMKWTPSLDDVEAPPNTAMSSSTHDDSNNPSQFPSTFSTTATEKSNPASRLLPKNDLPTSLKLAKFDINWETIPNDVLKQLAGHQPDAGYRGISETNYNRLVDYITAQIRTISTKIPFAIFRQVALRITNKYSTLRDCDDDGNIIGDGSNSLADKLRNHNSYLNRTHRIERHTTAHKLRSHRKCTVGVREEYYKSGMKHCSKEHLIVLTRKQSEELSEVILSGTEAYIRYKIDNSITLQSLLEDLPVIRRNEVLNHHFLKATGHSAEVFSMNFASKKAKFIEVSKSFNRTLHISSAATDLEVLEGVAKLLKENLSCLIHEIKDVHQEFHHEFQDPLPSIVFINQCDVRIYYICAQKAILTMGCKDVVLAFQQLLLVHYVYFFQYAKNISKTLEFLQIYLLKLQPDKGTRSTATIVGKQQRMVAALIAKITKLEWKKKQAEESDI